MHSFLWCPVGWIRRYQNYVHTHSNNGNIHTFHPFHTRLSDPATVALVVSSAHCQIFICGRLGGMQMYAHTPHYTIGEAPRQLAYGGHALRRRDVAMFATVVSWSGLRCLFSYGQSHRRSVLFLPRDHTVVTSDGERETYLIRHDECIR